MTARDAVERALRQAFSAGWLNPEGFAERTVAEDAHMAKHAALLAELGAARLVGGGSCDLAGDWDARGELGDA